MPQVSIQEFERLPLRVHRFLAGVPLHDAWFVDLPRWRAGVTLDDFLRTASNCLFTSSSLVRMLLDIRFFVGRFFDWDREPAATTAKSFATRLTDTDHSKSLAAAGTRDGFFRVVYRFENEQLVELINRTAHAGGAERPGRDSDCLPVLFRGLCPQRKPLHAVLHDTDRPFSKTDRLSLPLA
jgi:hypothetical protein